MWLQVPDGQSKDQQYQVEHLETPNKSEYDAMKYRAIRLPNGLTALLISTHEEESDVENEDIYTDDECDSKDNSSDEQTEVKVFLVECSLCVGVGGFNDPPAIPGMSHLLEHMISKGSEKFPREMEFYERIHNHRGCINFHTDLESTTYYFALGGFEEKYLLSALDCFAQMFIKPLMKKDAIIRERQVIDSEFHLTSSNDWIRNVQLLSSFASAGHPVHKPFPGNLITLRDNVDDDKLYEELHKFRKRYYSAHRMKLAVESTLPLDTLEKYVTMYFANIPNNDLPSDDFSAFKNGVSFDTLAFRKMYKVKPFKDISKIYVTWSMPSLLNLYKSKPWAYVSFIIGFKGRGSLTSYLSKKMWCLDLSFGNLSEMNFDNSIFGMASLIVMLSYKGQQHLEEVLNAIFSFINLIKKEGPQKRIHDEIYEIEDYNFRFFGKSNVHELCRNMHLYPPRDYITGRHYYLDYDPEAIQQYLDYLVPETANIMIFNKDFDYPELDKIEPWYKIKYTDIEIPKEWIERWKTIEPLPDFHLPLPNVFLARNFSLTATPKKFSKYPVKVQKDQLAEIWYISNFFSPTCYVNFHLISSLNLQSLKKIVLTEMYCTVLKQLLNGELHSAIMAGLNYVINASEKGIIIKISGYHEKQPLLMTIIAKHIADYLTLVTKDLFEIVKVEQLKQYYNMFIDPGQLINDVMSWILKKDVDYTHIDKYTALDSINFEEFQDFVKSFTDRLYIQCLVQGNVKKQIAIKIAREFIDIIKHDPLFIKISPTQKSKVSLPLGASYCKLKNLNKIDINSVVGNYYEVGVKSIKLVALLNLIETIMHVPLFNQLRTQEQLGYKIFCNSTDVNDVVGYFIFVHTQVNKYTTEYVDQRIEEFLKSFNNILEEFSEKEFDYIKDMLRMQKRTALFRSKVDINWHEITTRQHMFDRIEKEMLAIEDITIDDLTEFAKHMLADGSNFRKLSVQIVGTDPKESVVNEADSTAEKARCFALEYITDDQLQKETKVHYITDVKDYKKNLLVYI